MWFKRILMLWLSLVMIHWSAAQELNANVIINDVQVQTQERQVIQQLRDAIATFMNTTRWTNDNYKQHERIRCNILITLTSGTDVASGRYTANVQIQSSRPVYGASYETVLLTFFDRSFNFEFLPSQPLIFTENVFSTNLTAMLAYYAYTILALDADSFAPRGGNPYIERLLNIMNNSQQANAQGWNNSDTRNRYFIAENLNNPQLNGYREALYLYHRKGLDYFAENSEAGRKNILEALKKIAQVNQVRPNAVMINAFFDSKAEEIVNIFSQADAATRKEVATMLTRIDPTNANRYQALGR
ncbi:type IX secretion system protein PorD [Rhodoflexus sp.]